MRAISLQQLETLKKYLMATFLDKVRELPEWSGLIREREDAAEEANRLCELLTLQEVIDRAAADKNEFKKLTNVPNTIHRDIEVGSIAGNAHRALFSFFGPRELQAISKQLGNDESVKKAVGRVLIDLTTAYYAANPVTPVSDDVLKRHIAMLKTKLLPGFLEKVNALPAWAELTHEKVNLLDEANRLCQLLTLQEVIDRAAADKNEFKKLTNVPNTIHRDIEVGSIAGNAHRALFSFSGPTELQAISKQLGNDESVEKAVGRVLIALTTAYYAANPVTPVSDDVLKRHIAMLKTKLLPGFLEKVNALPAWAELTHEKVNLLDEANRLCELLTLQKVIGSAEADKDELKKIKNLPNESHRDIEANLIAGQAHRALFSFSGPRELQAISKQLGNDEFIQSNLKVQLMLLSHSYFGAYLSMKKMLSEEELKNYIAMIRERKPRTALEFKNLQSEFLIKLEENKRLLIGEIEQATADKLALTNLELQQMHSRELIVQDENHKALLAEIEKTIAEEVAMREEAFRIEALNRHQISAAEDFERRHSDLAKLHLKETIDRKEIAIENLSEIEAKHRLLLEAEKVLVDSKTRVVADIKYRSALLETCNYQVWTQEVSMDLTSRTSNDSSDDSSDDRSVDTDYFSRMQAIKNAPFEALLQKYPEDAEVESLVLKNNPQLALLHLSIEKITALFLKDETVLDFFSEKCSKVDLLDLLNRMTDQNAIYKLYVRSNHIYQLDPDIIQVAYQKNPAVIAYITNPGVIRHFKNRNFANHFKAIGSEMLAGSFLNDAASVFSMISASGQFVPELKELIMLFFRGLSRLTEEYKFSKVFNALLEKSNRRDEKALENLYKLFIRFAKDAIDPKQMASILREFYSVLKSTLRLDVTKLPEEKQAIFSKFKKLAELLSREINGIQFDLFCEALEKMTDAEAKEPVNNPLKKIEGLIIDWFKEKAARADALIAERVRAHARTIQESTTSLFFAMSGIYMPSYRASTVSRRTEELPVPTPKDIISAAYTLFLMALEMTVGIETIKKAAQVESPIMAFSLLLNAYMNPSKEDKAARKDFDPLVQVLRKIFLPLLKNIFKSEGEKFFGMAAEFSFWKSLLLQGYVDEQKVKDSIIDGLLFANLTKTISLLMEKNVIQMEDCSIEMQKTLRFRALQDSIVTMIDAKIGFGKTLTLEMIRQQEISISPKYNKLLIETRTLIKSAINDAELAAFIETQLEKIKHDGPNIARNVLKNCLKQIQEFAQKELASELVLAAIDDAKTEMLQAPLLDAESDERKKMEADALQLTNTVAEQNKVISDEVGDRTKLENAQGESAEIIDQEKLVFSEHFFREKLQRSETTLREILSQGHVLNAEAMVMISDLYKEQLALRDVILQQGSLLVDEDKARKTVDFLESESIDRLLEQNNRCIQLIADIKQLYENCEPDAREVIAVQEIKQRALLSRYTELNQTLFANVKAYENQKVLEQSGALMKNAYQDKLDVEYVAMSSELNASLPKIAKYSLAEFKRLSCDDLSGVLPAAMVIITDGADKVLAGNYREIYDNLMKKYIELRKETTLFHGAEFAVNVEKYYVKKTKKNDFTSLNHAQKLLVFMQYSDAHPGERTDNSLRSLWKAQASKTAQPKR